MRHCLIVNGHSHSCKRVKVKLFFEEGKLTNPKAIAASSIVGWGEWQTSYKVNTKWGPAWYVTTAGHGGYILVTQEKVPLFGDPTHDFSHEKVGDVYVYEFEEDCNWAMLEYADEGVRNTAMAKRNSEGRKEPWTPETYMAAIVRSLTAWNKEWLEERQKEETLAR